jgi:ABC-type multidrug transport system fused ATPase/permease subunit
MSIESGGAYGTFTNDEEEGTQWEGEMGVVFSNIRYEIEVPERGGLCSCRGKNVKKVILKGVSGCCPPASLLAIMGSSGAGKVLFVF